MLRRETETLIVGSGVAGSLVAQGLLQRGSGEVTILDAGPSVKMRDRRSWLDYVMAGKLPYDQLGDTPLDFESSGPQSWSIPGGRLFARGGSTLHWGGWCPRMKPEDFHLKSLIGHGGLDWPFDYKYLEPYYMAAEHYLQVAGDSSSNDPARSASYLFEAPAYTHIDGKIIAALERLGWGYGHIPIARNGAPISGLSPCMTTGTCGYCPIGGRFTGDQPLDRLAANKNFTLQLDAAVTQVCMDAKNRATGVIYRNLSTGEEHRIDAARVILCGGSLENPKLLLASRNQFWSQGVGNDSDQVGRHLIANPYFYANGMRPDNPEQLAEETWFATLGSRHWDTPAQQRDGKFFLNRADAPQMVDAEMLLNTMPNLKQAAAGMSAVGLQGTMQTFSHPANRICLAGGTTRFGLPRSLIEMPIPVVSKEQIATNLGRMRLVLETMGYQVAPNAMGSYPQRGDHAMCTTRMSTSPQEGVVDPSLRVHGVDNLFVVSNSVFPSGSPANPTLTLTALALRFVDQLMGIRAKQPGKDTQPKPD